MTSIKQPKAPSKIIQIAASADNLYALDDKGFVWVWHHLAECWVLRA